jgi:hypothetical protein
MAEEENEKSVGIAIIRWIARGFGLVISGFFLFVFIRQVWGAHLQHPTESGLEGVDPFATTVIVLMGIYILGMLVALSWEHTGTLLSMGGIGTFSVIVFIGMFPGKVSGGFSTRGILNPLVLVLWLPVLLYVVCWVLERKQRRRVAG